MASITLDDRDVAILDRLRRGDAAVESLAADVSASTADLRERLPQLADNGLVRAADDGYAITADGERALAGSPAGTEDDRIDTPPDVERAIRSFDLRPDRAEAVRAAFAFLAYWGDATGSEIVDAVYSEAPAGHDSHEAWWTDCVRDRLAELPAVDPPGSTDDRWRFDGTPTVARATDDGRTVAGDDVPSRSSVRAALEDAALADRERSAVRAAFAWLFEAGEATGAEMRDRIYPAHGAGYDSPTEWWGDLVREEFGRLPGVERQGDDRWAYRGASGGTDGHDDPADTGDAENSSADTGD